MSVENNKIQSRQNQDGKSRRKGNRVKRKYKERRKNLGK